MTTTIELSIAGRGENDAPRLDDLIGQLQDFFSMVNGVAASIAGDDIQRFDWQVIGLSKNSPARIVVEAVPTPGHAEGPELAAAARNATMVGLYELAVSSDRPVYFSDNVIEAADRFARRLFRGLAETRIEGGNLTALRMAPTEASRAINNITLITERAPVSTYRELGSVEGYIQNVGTDGYGRPYIIVKSRVSGADARCFLSGDALRQLESTPVAEVVWRQRRVTARGLLRYRSPGRLSSAEIDELVFEDSRQRLPQLRDIIDLNFTGGASSSEYLERVRSGEA
ncbi:hypothetical protein ABC347_11045 [Sphingomonas sp. 1P06PA]|uniref:hypothetical protein n=1 Tax=Sphingomonas sp. 1P06PA TaxID=554121 RepID=UPI0039A569CB